MVVCENRQRKIALTIEIVKAEFHKLDRAKCERVWVSLTDIYWQILLVVRQVRLSKNWRQITNPPRSPFAG